jgi:probable RNA-binding protein EIF1AD
MAGLGRRTHYRKHLTDSVLHDLPEPKDDERIAKVVSTRGLNQFDILIASSASSIDEERKPQLAILPTKFHKLVWVKRGDFVIVQTGSDKDTKQDEGGIRYIITHILYKDQVKHLKSKNLWPVHDPEFQNYGEAEVKESSANPKENNDGIVYGNAYGNDSGSEADDDDLFVNTNRLARLEIQDSSDSSDDSDEG